MKPCDLPLICFVLTAGAPEPSYGAPEPSYSAPAPAYGAPAYAAQRYYVSPARLLTVHLTLMMLQDPYAAQAATALGAESAYSPDLNPYNLPQVKFGEKNQA